MKCKHCVELKTAHLEIYSLKENLADLKAQLGTKYDSAKSLALCNCQV
jgi:hypothetical protein